MKNALYIQWYAKGTSRTEVTLNSEKIKHVVFSDYDSLTYSVMHPTAIGPIGILTGGD